MYNKSVQRNFTKSFVFFSLSPFSLRIFFFFAIIIILVIIISYPFGLRVKTRLYYILSVAYRFYNVVFVFLSSRNKTKCLNYFTRNSTIWYAEIELWVCRIRIIIPVYWENKIDETIIRTTQIILYVRVFIYLYMRSKTNRVHLGTGIKTNYC